MSGTATNRATAQDAPSTLAKDARMQRQIQQPVGMDDSDGRVFGRRGGWDRNRILPEAGSAVLAAAPMTVHRIIASLFLITVFWSIGVLQPSYGISVCQWHSMTPAPELTLAYAATRNVAEGMAAENWTLAGLQGRPSCEASL